jgi:hypothetical protein
VGESNHIKRYRALVFALTAFVVVVAVAAMAFRTRPAQDGPDAAAKKDAGAVRSTGSAPTSGASPSDTASESAASASSESAASASAQSASALPPAPRTPSPWLIKHGWDIPTPEFVRDHVTDMEKSPFDGVVVRMPELSDKVQRQEPVSFEQFQSALEPMSGVRFDRLQHNFVMVYTTPAGSYFDDYETPIANFAKLARAVRLAGFKGILFDNEEYFGSLSDYPDVCPGHTLAQCRVQAARRGREMMDAIREEWPDVTVMTFFGAWISDPLTGKRLPPELNYNDLSSHVELIGPFFVGMVESVVGTNAKVVDGGEFYTARKREHFEALRAWQTDGMATSSGLIPKSLKPKWTSTVSTAFGVYDLPFLDVGMDVDAWRSTIANALETTDEYVWAYTEQHDWWGMGHPREPVPDEWVTATREARETARAARSASASLRGKAPAK